MSEVCELRLCESRRLILQPNKLYRFTVDWGCIDCVALAKDGAVSGIRYPTKPPRRDRIQVKQRHPVHAWFLRTFKRRAQ